MEREKANVDANSGETSPSRMVSPPQLPQVPDHSLIRKIAEGSYGEVWLARNILGTFRAVKILYRKRFDHDRPYEREYEGIQKFEPLSRSHEGFVDVLQIGRNEAEGYFYYVMELGDDHVKAQNISPDAYHPKTLSSEVSTRGRLPVEECLHLALTITDALRQLHEHGLTHRDIKPSNIIFVNGTPKLADIGLVADIGHDRSYVGTEGFIAPEGPGTPQADLFSLGKVLYEMSTGKDRNDFPELPDNFDSFPDAEAFREFNEVVIRACHGDRDQRYASARKMYAELAVIINGDSVRRLRHLERRLNLIRHAGVIVLLLAVIGGVIGYPVYRESKIRQAEQVRQVGIRLTEAAAAMQQGHMTDAIAATSKSLQLTEQNEAESELNRLRCVSTLYQCPKLVQMSFNASSISSVAFSPDGKKLLYTVEKKFVEVRDIESDTRLPFRLAADQFPVMAAYSPNGKQIVTAGANKTACLWNAETGEKLRMFLHSNWVCWAQFSADGSRLLTSTMGSTNVNDQKVFIWSIEGALIDSFTAHADHVFMAAFSRDQRMIATASRDFNARVWENGESHRLLRSFPHQSWVLYADFNPDGSLLATSGFDRQAHVWDLATGKEILPAMNHRDGVCTVQFSPDGKKILTASAEGIVRFWDAATHLPLAENSLLHSSDRITFATFNQEGNQVAFSSNDGSIRIWDYASETPCQKTNVTCFSPNGTLALSVAAQELSVYDSTAKSLWKGVCPYPAGVQKYAFSENGQWLCAIRNAPAPDESRILIWNLRANDKNPRELPVASPITQVALAAKGLAAYVFKTNQIQCFDLASATPVGPVLTVREEVAFCAFSPDERQLLVAAGKILHSFAPTTGTAAHSPLTFVFKISHVAFSHNAKVFAVSLANNDWDECYAALYDVRTHFPVGSLLRHRDGVIKTSFSLDGTKIATASEDFTARVWDISNGQPVTPPLPHDHQVMDVDFSPDSRQLLTVSIDKTSRIWDANTGEPLTPPIHFPDKLEWGHFDRAGYQAFIRSTHGEFWLLSYPKDNRPVSDWQNIAYLLSGSSWTAQQANDQQAPDVRRRKLQETWVTMKAKYPQDFGGSLSAIQRWHQQEVIQAQADENQYAARFHLDWMLKHEPTNTFALERMAKTRDKLHAEPAK